MQSEALLCECLGSFGSKYSGSSVDVVDSNVFVFFCFFFEKVGVGL